MGSTETAASEAVWRTERGRLRMRRNQVPEYVPRWLDKMLLKHRN